MRIQSVGTRFPDALIQVKQGSRWVIRTAEFEKFSSDFKKHGHLKQIEHGTDCHYMICWRDDWQNRPEGIEAIELKKELARIL